MLLSEDGGTRGLCLVITTYSEGRRPCPPLCFISRPSRLGELCSLSAHSLPCGRRMHVDGEQPEFYVYPAPEDIGLSFLVYNMGILPRICVCACTHMYTCPRIHMHGVLLLLLHCAKDSSNHIISVISLSLYNNTIRQVPLSPSLSADGETGTQRNQGALEGYTASKRQSQDPNVTMWPQCWCS